MGIFTYKILAGKAKNISHSFTTHKGTSRNVALFELGKKQIRLTLNKPIAINEGDKVLVTGRASLDGCFKAFAYRNIDKRVTAKASLLLLPALKIFYVVVALAFLDVLVFKNTVYISYVLEAILVLFALILFRQVLSIVRLRFTRSFSSNY